MCVHSGLLHFEHAAIHANGARRLHILQAAKGSRQGSLASAALSHKLAATQVQRTPTQTAGLLHSKRRSICCNAILTTIVIVIGGGIFLINAPILRVRGFLVPLARGLRFELLQCRDSTPRSPPGLAVLARVLSHRKCRRKTEMKPARSCGARMSGARISTITHYYALLWAYSPVSLAPDCGQSCV